MDMCLETQAIESGHSRFKPCPLHEDTQIKVDDTAVFKGKSPQGTQNWQHTNLKLLASYGIFAN